MQFPSVPKLGYYLYAVIKTNVLITWKLRLLTEQIVSHHLYLVQLYLTLLEE